MLRAIEVEAAHAGESTSEFIRAAAFARAVIRYEQRGGELSKVLVEFYEVARELDRQHQASERDGD